MLSKIVIYNTSRFISTIIFEVHIVVTMIQLPNAKELPGEFSIIRIV